MDIIIRLIADGLVFAIALMAAALFMSAVRSNHYQTYTRAFMAGLTAYLLAKIMSLFYQTLERPFVTLGVEPKAAYLNNPGFPSDHALFVMTAALIVLSTVKNKTAIVILFLMVLLVGTGRVVALVHTPQDIIGGYIAAFIGVGLWYKFFVTKAY